MNRVSFWIVLWLVSFSIVTAVCVLMSQSVSADGVPGMEVYDSLTSGLNQQPTQDEWSRFIALAKGANSSSFMVLSLLAVQAAFLIFRTAAGELLGFYRLLVLAILSVGATIGANLLSGKSVMESLVYDSSTLWTYQVAFHQLKRQWEKRAKDREDLELCKRASADGVRARNFEERQSTIVD